MPISSRHTPLRHALLLAGRLRALRGWSRAAVCSTVAVTAAALVACGKTKDLSPADVALQFYVTLELGGVREVPEPRALIALEPYLTDTLITALRAARAVRDRPERGAGVSPPFTDGNPFSGLFEGHSTYRVGTTARRGDTALVIMSFTNIEQKPTLAWQDTLVLVTHGTGASSTWRVADLRYGTDWEFGYRGSLRGVLQDGRRTPR
jgi:hypothetical protein